MLGVRPGSTGCGCSVAVTTPYLLGWLGLAVLAVANGVVREFSYGRWMSQLAAHQLSTLLAIVLTGLFAWGLHRRWPLQSRKLAWRVGAIWLCMTIAFEFGFGHWIAGHSWEKLLADYNIVGGRVWGLFLIWLFVLPPLLHAVNRQK